MQRLKRILGPEFGLVRGLYFDKHPERTWSLGWHKDTAIAVTTHGMESRHFSRPTVKAGIPHVIASDAILRNMLTLRIHLDEVTNENGPLRVVPQSHEARDCEGTGTESAKIILAERGEILAMRPLLSHGSGASDPGTKRHRRSTYHVISHIPCLYVRLSLCAFLFYVLGLLQLA